MVVVVSGTVVVVVVVDVLTCGTWSSALGSVERALEVRAGDEDHVHADHLVGLLEGHRADQVPGHEAGLRGPPGRVADVVFGRRVGVAGR